MLHNALVWIRLNTAKELNGECFFSVTILSFFPVASHRLICFFYSFFFLFARTFYGNERGESIGESIIQSNAVKYRACDKFIFICAGCKKENEIAKPYYKIDGKFTPVLQVCANTECNYPPIQQLANVRNQLAMAMRKAIQRYYDNTMMCDEPHCNQIAQAYIHVGFRI